MPPTPEDAEVPQARSAASSPRAFSGSPAAQKAASRGSQRRGTPPSSSPPAVETRTTAAPAWAMVDDYEAIRNKAVPVYQGGSSSPVYQSSPSPVRSPPSPIRSTIRSSPPPAPSPKRIRPPVFTEDEFPSPRMASPSPLPLRYDPPPPPPPPPRRINVPTATSCAICRASILALHVVRHS